MYFQSCLPLPHTQCSEHPQLTNLVPRTYHVCSHFVQDFPLLLFKVASLTLLSNCHLLIVQKIFPDPQFGLDLQITCYYYQNTYPIVFY